MKKTISYNCILGLCIYSISFALSCGKPLSESIINPKAGWNGSFEIVKEGLPVNWLVYTQKTIGKGDFDIKVDNNNFKSGKQSLLFMVRECSNKGGRFSPGIAQEIEVQSNKEYRLSFWVRNHSATFSIQLNGVNAFHQNDGPEIKSSEEIQNWRQYEMKYSVPNDMKRLRFSVSLLSPGEFWIDDIQLLSVE